MTNDVSWTRQQKRLFHPGILILQVLLLNTMRAAFVASALAIASAYPNLNVVQRLQLIPDASTLVTAVVAGNLATALSGKGPFTVFA